MLLLKDDSDLELLEDLEDLELPEPEELPDLELDFETGDLSFGLDFLGAPFLSLLFWTFYFGLLEINLTTGNILY